MQVAHRVRKSQKTNLTWTRIKPTTNCCSPLARELARALDHSSTELDYEVGSKFLKLILADFHDDDEVEHILGHRFFELGRVEASHWTWSSMMVSTFIRKWKILLRYCYFWHTERLKNFRQEFYLLQKWKTSNFPNLSQVRAPISDSFILFRKLFKVIFFLKLSPKCLGNTLKLFKTSWFIQNLDDFWLCVYMFSNP